MENSNNKVKKLVSSSADLGDGVFATITVDDDDMTQEILDGIAAAMHEIGPRIWECALRHKEEFDENDQKLIQIVCEGL